MWMMVDVDGEEDTDYIAGPGVDSMCESTSRCSLWWGV